jgi:SPP1 family phage portal protein
MDDIDAEDIETGMNAETLKKLIDKHKMCIPKYLEQKAYAIGNNPPIFMPRPKPSPDNRIAIPYIYSELQFVKGYMFKAGNTKYTGDYYDNILKPIYDMNEEELINADEGEEWLKHGVVYELHWTEDGKKYFWPVPVEQAIAIYDDKLKKSLVGFIYYRCTDDETETATYYDATSYTDWTTAKDKDKWVAGPTVAHGYKQVPVNVQTLTKDGRNFFDHVRGLINLLDKLLSEDVANEAERFNAALLLMKNRISTIADEHGLSDVDKIKLTRIIDQLDGDSPVKDQVDFLIRDIPVQFIEFAFKKAEGLLHQNLTGLDPGDDRQTADNSSGFALLLKLFRFELQCASYESRWIRFLQNRIRLISGITDSTSVSEVKGANDVTITMSRNLPVNMQVLADVASKLVGILPEKAVLGLFPTDILGMSTEDALKELDSEKPDLMTAPPIPQNNEVTQ